MRTKVIDGIERVFRDDYLKDPEAVVNHILIDFKRKKFPGQRRMSASKRVRLNRKLRIKRIQQQWTPALYAEDEDGKVIGRRNDD